MVNVLSMYHVGVRAEIFFPTRFFVKNWAYFLLRPGNEPDLPRLKPWSLWREFNNIKNSLRIQLLGYHLKTFDSHLVKIDLMEL